MVTAFRTTQKLRRSHEYRTWKSIQASPVNSQKWGHGRRPCSALWREEKIFQRKKRQQQPRRGFDESHGFKHKHMFKEILLLLLLAPGRILIFGWSGTHSIPDCKRLVVNSFLNAESASTEPLRPKRKRGRGNSAQDSPRRWGLGNKAWQEICRCTNWRDIRRRGRAHPAVRTVPRNWGFQRSNNCLAADASAKYLISSN